MTICKERLRAFRGRAFRPGIRGVRRHKTAGVLESSAVVMAGAEIAAKQANGCLIVLHTHAVLAELSSRRSVAPVEVETALVLLQPPLILLKLPLIGMDVMLGNSLRQKNRAERQESGKHNQEAFLHGRPPDQSSCTVVTQFPAKITKFSCCRHRPLAHFERTTSLSRQVVGWRTTQESGE